MSLTRAVVAAVHDMGSATLDDIWPRFRDTHTRAQVLQALKNARRDDLLHCEGHVPKRGQGRSAGSEPARHFPGPRPTTPAQRPTRLRPPNSAWELGSMEFVEAWPPLNTGTKHQILGEW